MKKIEKLEYPEGYLMPRTEVIDDILDKLDELVDRVNELTDEVKRVASGSVAIV